MSTAFEEEIARIEKLRAETVQALIGLSRKPEKEIVKLLFQLDMTNGFESRKQHVKVFFGDEAAVISMPMSRGAQSKRAEMVLAGTSDTQRVIWASGGELLDSHEPLWHQALRLLTALWSEQSDLQHKSRERQKKLARHERALARLNGVTYVEPLAARSLWANVRERVFPGAR